MSVEGDPGAIHTWTAINEVLKPLEPDLSEAQIKTAPDRYVTWWPLWRIWPSIFTETPEALPNESDALALDSTHPAYPVISRFLHKASVDLTGTETTEIHNWLFDASFVAWLRRVFDVQIFVEKEAAGGRRSPWSYENPSLSQDLAAVAACRLQIEHAIAMTDIVQNEADDRLARNLCWRVYSVRLVRGARMSAPRIDDEISWLIHRFCHERGGYHSLIRRASRFQGGFDVDAELSHLIDGEDAGGSTSPTRPAVDYWKRHARRLDAPETFTVTLSGKVPSQLLGRVNKRFLEHIAVYEPLPGAERSTSGTTEAGGGWLDSDDDEVVTENVTQSSDVLEPGIGTAHISDEDILTYAVVGGASPSELVLLQIMAYLQAAEYRRREDRTTPDLETEMQIGEHVARWTKHWRADPQFLDQWVADELPVTPDQRQVWVDLIRGAFDELFPPDRPVESARVLEIRRLIRRRTEKRLVFETRTDDVAVRTDPRGSEVVMVLNQGDRVVQQGRPRREGNTLWVPVSVQKAEATGWISVGDLRHASP